MVIIATNPSFASTPLVGSVLAPSTNDASLTAPTHTALVVAPGASGSRIDYIRIYGVGTTVAGRLNIWRKDASSNFWLQDQVLITAVTPSATTAVFSVVNTYAELELLSTDLGLYISVMETGNESLLVVSAHGGSF